MEDHPQPESKQEPTLLQRIRNMWEFANLAQYIYMFGKAVKIDEDFGIEVRVRFTYPFRSRLYCTKHANKTYVGTRDGMHDAKFSSPFEYRPRSTQVRFITQRAHVCHSYLASTSY